MTARTAAPASTGAAVRGVQSVVRSLDVLELLERSGPSGLSEVASGTGLPEGTAHRLLRTLIVRGYVRQGHDRRYALGTRLLALGDGARRATVSASTPFLARLVELSGETANLAVLEGDHVVYVAQVPSAHRLRLFAEVGRHVAAHSTGVGKVLLASLSDAEVRSLVARTGLPPRTPRTVSSIGALLEELASIRQSGWAVDDEEEETGVRCIAVPVLDQGRVVAAMSVSGPTTRMPSAPTDGLLRGLRAAAADFATAVGATS